MVNRIKVTTIYNCSLERAFKTAILSDVTKVHTGYGFTPRVTHATDDADWGKVGSSKKIYTAKTFFQEGGFASVDHILERKENEYWKIQVDEFQSFLFGFYKFVGEWKTTQLSENNIQVDYTYELHSDKPLFYPINWLFAKLFWKRYMKHVLENIRKMCDEKEPYQYQ